MGFSVKGNLYLYCDDFEYPTAFDITRIKEIEKNGDGAIIKYQLDEEDKTVYTFKIRESAEEVEKAKKEAEVLRSAAIDKINSML